MASNFNEFHDGYSVRSNSTGSHRLRAEYRLTPVPVQRRAYDFVPTVRSSARPRRCGGDYTLRIAGAGRLTSAPIPRYYFRLETATGVTPARRASVYADDAAYARLDLVSNQSCQNCHSTFAGRLTSHHYNPFNAEACMACHSAVNPPDEFSLVKLAHGIHNSHEMPSGRFRPGRTTATTTNDQFSVTYPTYMTNCSVCHDSTETLQAANAMPVTGPGCLSCHGSMESWDFAASGATFHEAYNETTDCQECHRVNGVAASLVKVTDFHNGIVTERGGLIWGGVDTSVTEGAKFNWQITGIVDDKTNLKITWTAKYNGVDVNPCNTALAAGTPVFHAGSTAAGTASNLSMLRSYFQGDDSDPRQEHLRSGPGSRG